MGLIRIILSNKIVENTFCQIFPPDRRSRMEDPNQLWLWLLVRVAGCCVKVMLSHFKSPELHPHDSKFR